MTILGGFPIFNYLSSQSRNDRFRKSFGPLSSALKRQPFSTTTQRQIPKSTNYNNYYKQDTSNNNAHQSGPEIITENSILNNFPRPNLMPTLHFSLFGNTDANNNKKTTTCKNCTGPHSTEFCPC